MNKIIKIIICIFMIFMLLGVIIDLIAPTNESVDKINIPVGKTNDQVANELMDILTTAGLKDFRIVVTDYEVQFYINGIAALPDYQKKQLITVLIKTVTSVRSDGIASTIIYDEYGIKVISARLSLWADNGIDIKIN